jgi:hypothetical protein
MYVVHCGMDMKHSKNFDLLKNWNPKELENIQHWVNFSMKYQLIKTIGVNLKHIQKSWSIKKLKPRIIEKFSTLGLFFNEIPTC